MKGVLQIPLRHFLSDLQTNGSEESSKALPGAATTQSDLPNASNPSKKPSSTSTSKPGPSTARHVAAGTQPGRSRNSSHKRNEPASSIPLAGPDAEHLHAALHQGRERAHLPVHPCEEGHLEAHHLQGKGPCQKQAQGKRGKR